MYAWTLSDLKLQNNAAYTVGNPATRQPGHALSRQ